MGLTISPGDEWDKRADAIKEKLENTRLNDLDLTISQLCTIMRVMQVGRGVRAQDVWGDIVDIERFLEGRKH